MKPPLTGRTVVAGVAGKPVRHSLSPVIHNAWLQDSGVDGVYAPFSPRENGFTDFALGLRGGVIRGLNVTAPFKEQALALADQASERARRTGSANLLLFEADGVILADNTDGLGLLHAFGAQLNHFDPKAGPVVILGAGGAARGAAAAFLDAGAPEVWFVNRHEARAEALVQKFGVRTRAVSLAHADTAWRVARIVINATPLGLNDESTPDVALDCLDAGCAVMDMVYRPVRTALLRRAALLGLATVDGLEMLIGQAAPSFEAFFGVPPPPTDIRALAVAAMENDV